MDLGQLFKAHILKKRNPNFGSMLDEQSVMQRVEKFQQTRRTTRHEAMNVRRVITNSPYITPASNKTTKKKTQTKIDTIEPERDLVKERLLKWKAEKERMLAKEKKPKPNFKVCHSSGFLDAATALKEIKGKPLEKNTKFKLAPSSTYKFKPPPNIRPIQFNQVKKTKGKPKIVNENIERRVTRSQTAQKPLYVEPPKQSRKKLEFGTSSKTQLENNGKSSKLTNRSATPKKLKKTPRKETKTPIKDKIEGVEQITTPDNQIAPVIYISPFVTISRGKRNAAKEYHQRRLEGGTYKEGPNDCSQSTSPKRAILYFEKILDDKTTHFQSLCANWNSYKVEENPPEEVCNMIDVAIGQTSLLLGGKFSQFKQLLRKCEGGQADPPITCMDLHGFWDVIHIQIQNLITRFENLKDLKSRNWEEILPEIKTEIKQKKRKVKPKIKASSNLMAAIAEGRKKKEKENYEDEMISLQTPKRKSRRRSSRIATQESTLGNSTSKGILKSANTNTEKKKRVFFHDDSQL